MKSLSGKYIYRFIETIRIQAGEPKLLELHQHRVNHTFKYFYPGVAPIQLHEINFGSSSIYSDCVKCRISYNDRRYKIDYSAYHLKPIRKLVIMHDCPSYPFKFKDRSILEAHGNQLNDNEEALFISDNRIRESSYANVLLKIEGRWKTPMYPMFYGVMRSHLLQKGKIHEADLFLNDLNRCSEIALVNAMMPLESCVRISTV